MENVDEDEGNEESDYDQESYTVIYRANNGSDVPTVGGPRL